MISPGSPLKTGVFWDAFYRFGRQKLSLFKIPIGDDLLAAWRQGAKFFGNQSAFGNRRFCKLSGKGGDLFAAMSTTSEFLLAFATTHRTAPSDGFSVD
ncbi:MAG: hypothetical protein LLF97_08470 [Planctomycetaceae bacterium]|nr:hypothetical protein [Planctomycetaceae bacterium]